MSLSLKTDRSNQTLDLWCLESLGFPLLLREWPLDDVLSYIILFRQVVELADFPNTFGSQSSRDGVVSQTWNEE